MQKPSSLYVYDQRQRERAHTTDMYTMIEAFNLDNYWIAAAVRNCAECRVILLLEVELHDQPWTLNDIHFCIVVMHILLSPYALYVCSLWRCVVRKLSWLMMIVHVTVLLLRRISVRQCHESRTAFRWPIVSSYANAANASHIVFTLQLRVVSTEKTHTIWTFFFNLTSLFFFLLAYFVLKARSVSKYTSLDSVNHTSNQIQYPNRLFFGLSPESVSDFDRPSVAMNGLDFGGARQRMIAR